MKDNARRLSKFTRPRLLKWAQAAEMRLEILTEERDAARTAAAEWTARATVARAAESQAVLERESARMDADHLRSVLHEERRHLQEALSANDELETECSKLRATATVRDELLDRAHKRLLLINRIGWGLLYAGCFIGGVTGMYLWL